MLEAFHPTGSGGDAELAVARYVAAQESSRLRVRPVRPVRRAPLIDEQLENFEEWVTTSLGRVDRVLGPDC